MRVLSVYPVRLSRQQMNNRHCGSILWILNQWLWERALANTYGSPRWAAGSRWVENTKTSPSVSLGGKKRASHLYWRCSLLCRSASLAGDDKQAVCAERLPWRCNPPPPSPTPPSEPAYQWIPDWDSENAYEIDIWINVFSGCQCTKHDVLFEGSASGWYLVGDGVARNRVTWHYHEFKVMVQCYCVVSLYHFY